MIQDDPFRAYDEAFEAWRAKQPGSKFSEFSLRRIINGLRKGRVHDTLGSNLSGEESWAESGRSMFETILAMHPLPANARVCDYGCGSLRVTSHFIRRQDRLCVFALDAVTDFMKIGKELLGEHVLQEKLPRFGVISARLENAAAFRPDLVYATSVARHVHPEEKPDFIDAMRRIAGKPGSVAIFDAYVADKETRFARSGWAWPLNFYLDAMAPLKLIGSKELGSGVTGWDVHRTLLAFQR
ncbi:hypothetical protein [Mesorhizobium sp. IMUNJ 23232]|uniref:hypothetical protein n=1 Tax=Mesorhizobium sp. IMUNJ 23232 TaxID=3376064 RepID=UPI00379CF0C3